VLTSVVGVVILLGGLIFFHELGHYLIAKFFGVKVEVFSLGFGKKLFKRQWGETEYCLSLIPLGGYVKLMGDDPYRGVPASEAARAFSTQKLYKRFAIVAAGPIFNLVLAFFLFTVIYWVGKPMAASRLGAVVTGSPAWEAGLRPGDKITDVAGAPVLTWNDLDTAVKTRTGETVDVTVERSGSALHFSTPIQKVQGRSPYGEIIEVGGIKGISPYPLSSKVGVSDPKSAAFEAGLRTGDRITKIDTAAVKKFEEVKDALMGHWYHNRPVTVTVERPTGVTTSEKSFTLEFPGMPKIAASSYGPLAQLGIFPTDVFVREVSKDSPAEKGGLLAGDRIAKVNGNDIFGFESIVEQVQAAGDKGLPLDFVIVRDGREVPLNLKPTETVQEDPLTHAPIKRYMVGFVPMTEMEDSETTKVQIHQIGPLVATAFHETFDMAEKMVISIVKLVTGSISVKNLGGPVLIASVAGKSLDAGFIPFLQTMALISINLFLLNLLPIPVLDGGHLLFFIIEAIKGKPVSIRTMELANQVGMVFILLLVALTFFNDISRIVLN
jgi:regulator of sigma E protease